MTIDRVRFDTERAGSPTAAFVAVGTALTVKPEIIIFDNQASGSVELSADGVHTWKTFVTTESLVLDLSTNGMRIDIGTIFYIKGTGTGAFRISIIYAG